MHLLGMELEGDAHLTVIPRPQPLEMEGDAQETVVAQSRPQKVI